LAVNLQASKIRHARRDGRRQRWHVCRMNVKMLLASGAWRDIRSFTIAGINLEELDPR
jgi:hypothetical protein